MTELVCEDGDFLEAGVKEVVLQEMPKEMKSFSKKQIRLIKNYSLAHTRRDKLMALEAYGRKNRLTNLLFIQLFQSSSHIRDPYFVLANIQGISYAYSWLLPVTLDLLYVAKTWRIGQKLRFFGHAALSSFEITIVRELE